MFPWVVLCAFLTVVGGSVELHEECRDVMTEAGVVRGCASSRDSIAFLGVPYAAPPVGRNRFKAPMRPNSWTGVYKADRIIKCPQRDEGVEDCLVVNIFTPIQTVTAPLSVLVYIHGGSFLIGAGQVQGADPLVKQNIIVVTINYRLGALGYLCLGTEDAPGNAGLKDQVAALQWVQRNIVNFGGDPNSVTLYGMSAGGAAVELLVLSNKSRGLFQRAIVESASATSVWATDLDPLATARNIARQLGLSENNTDAYSLGNYYRRVKASRLSQVNYEYYNNLIDGTFGFVPCIENLSEAILTESPYEILTQQKYEKVPIMFLYATLEGLYLRSEEYYHQNYKERMSANFLGFVPADLEFDSDEIKTTIAENIQAFYFGNKTIGEDIKGYLNYFGDYLIMHGLLNSAEKHSRNENPVYLMELAYKGRMGSYDRFYDNIQEAGHGDVVKHAILNRLAESNEDKRAVARVSALIANFVKFGNPTPQPSDLLPVIWPRVQPGNVRCLHLGHEFQVLEKPHWTRKEFWDQIYDTYRTKFKHGG